MSRLCWIIAILLIFSAVHIDSSQTESSKVVALEYCSPTLWESCANAVTDWSSLIWLPHPGRLRIRVELDDPPIRRIRHNRTDSQLNVYNLEPSRYLIRVTERAAAKEEIMRGIAVVLGFGDGPTPFDWIDREFPALGVFIEPGKVYSSQINGRIMSKHLKPGARLAASTVEAVRRAQGATSQVCISDSDCKPGLVCSAASDVDNLPSQCVKIRSESMSVATIALIAVWASAAALIVAL